MSAFSFKIRIFPWPAIFLGACLSLAYGLFSPLPTARGEAPDERLVITAADIAAMKVNKIADIFNQAPGLTAGSSSVSIHGSYKVRVYLDGAPLNDPTSSYGAINWDHVAPDSIERIEILRGSGSLRYGQDSSGGVILITTKPLKLLSGNIKVYGGNLDSGRAETNLTTRKGDWGFGFKSFYERSQGFKINNDSQRWQAGFKASFSPAADRYLSLAADYLEDRRGLSGLPDFPTPHSRQRTRNLALSLNGRYEGLANNLYYNSGRAANQDRDRQLDQNLTVTEIGDDLTYELTTGGFGRLALGAGYWRGEAEGGDFSPQSENAAYFFASQTLKSGDSPWSFSFGLRADLNSTFALALNPEGRLAYARDAWALGFLYSRSANTPSFQQRYNQTSSTDPNPNLGMEKADNFSLTFNIAPRENLTLNATLFYNILTDRITYVRPTGSGIGQYQNLGRVVYSGADAGFSWRLNPSLNFKGTYTYLLAEDREISKWLTSQARHKGRLELFWQPLPPLNAAFSLNYTGRTYNNRENTEELASYTLFNFRGEYAFDDYSLFCEVNNALNKTYYYVDGLLAPPRTWIFGVNWNI